MGWLSRSVQASRAFIARIAGYLVFLGTLVIVVVTFAADTGLSSIGSPSPLFLLTVVAGMIFLLRTDVSVAHETLSRKVGNDTGEMQAVATRIEGTQNAIDGAVTQQSNYVQAMRDALENAGRLWTLESAMRDLEPRFQKVRAGDTILIDHLGLDMTAAWDKLCPAIDALAGRAHVHFRLLILGRDGRGGVDLAGNARTPLPDDVEDWAGSGDKKRAQIEKKLGEIQAAAQAGGGAHSLTYEVRSYRDVPLVHGIRVRGPFQAAYLAISRWDERETDPFWWGGEQYHRILDPASAEQVDLREILDGYFNRWWMMNDPAAGAA